MNTPTVVPLAKLAPEVEACSVADSDVALVVGTMLDAVPVSRSKAAFGFTALQLLQVQFVVEPVPKPLQKICGSSSGSSSRGQAASRLARSTRVTCRMGHLNRYVSGRPGTAAT